MTLTVFSLHWARLTRANQYLGLVDYSWNAPPFTEVCASSWSIGGRFPRVRPYVGATQSIRTPRCDRAYTESKHASMRRSRGWFSSSTPKTSITQDSSPSAISNLWRAICASPLANSFPFIFLVQSPISSHSPAAFREALQMWICCWEEEERRVGNLRENKSLKYAGIQLIWQENNKRD